MLNIVLLFGAQIVYAFSDLWKKHILDASGGLRWNLLWNPAFLGATIIPVIGFLLYLTALHRLDLSRVAVIFSALGVVVFVAIGVFFRHETLSVWDLLGVLAAILAIIFIHIK